MLKALPVEGTGGTLQEEGAFLLPLFCFASCSSVWSPAVGGIGRLPMAFTPIKLQQPLIDSFPLSFPSTSRTRFPVDHAGTPVVGFLALKRGVFCLPLWRWVFYPLALWSSISCLSSDCGPALAWSSSALLCYPSLREKRYFLE